MRRWNLGAVVVVVGLLGCREMFQARPEIAAEVAGQRLPVERLASLMVQLKGVNLDLQGARFVANLWVDHTLLAQALAEGRALNDSSLVARIMWADLAEVQATAWHDTLVTRTLPPNPRAADSVYRGDDLRLLQHVLVRVSPRATQEEKTAAQKKATGLARQARAGSDFARLARESSEDQGSKADGGYLPPTRRGRWVAVFDSVGWRLEPGEIAGPVESPFGYHVIRRPPYAEIRERFERYLREEAGKRLDSLYLDSLGKARKLAVVTGAAKKLRAAVGDPMEYLASKEPIAHYRGGELSFAGLMRWVVALGPGWSADLVSQPDSNLIRFIQIVAQNQLLLEEARAAGVQVPPEVWAQVRSGYQGRLDTLRLSLGLSPEDLGDPGATADVRRRAAAMRVEKYWDEMAAGRSRPVAVPSQLAVILREGAQYSLFPAGIERAVGLAVETKAAQDPAGGPASAPPAGQTPGVVPAPVVPQGVRPPS